MEAELEAQLAADLEALECSEEEEEEESRGPLGGWAHVDVRPLASLDELVAGAVSSLDTSDEQLFDGLAATLRAGEAARERFSTEFQSLQELTASVPDDTWTELREQTRAWRPQPALQPHNRTATDAGTEAQASGSGGEVTGSELCGSLDTGVGEEPWWVAERRERAAAEAAREADLAAARQSAEAARRQAQEAAERAAADAAARVEEELQRQQTELLEAQQARAEALQAERARLEAEAEARRLAIAKEEARIAETEAAAAAREAQYAARAEERRKREEAMRARVAAQEAARAREAARLKAEAEAAARMAARKAALEAERVAAEARAKADAEERRQYAAAVALQARGRCAGARRRADALRQERADAEAARRRAEEERLRREAEAARRRAEEDARRKAELERLEAQRRAAAEAAAKARAEAEARRAEEEVRRRAELERLRAAEAARQAAAAEARRKAEEERRREEERKYSATAAIQAIVRGVQCRCRVGPRPDAARVLQRVWRNGAALKRARQRRAVEAAAAPRLQSLARGGLLRHRLARRLAAARLDDSDSELEDVDELLDDGWMRAAAEELDGYMPPPRTLPLLPPAPVSVLVHGASGDGASEDDDDELVVPYRVGRPAGGAPLSTSPMRAPLRPAAAASYAAMSAATQEPQQSMALSDGDPRGGIGVPRAANGVVAASTRHLTASGGYAHSEGGESAREMRREEARERMMSEWGLSDARTAELLLRRKNRMGAQRKRAEKKRELQDPMKRLEHAQILARSHNAHGDARRHSPVLPAANVAPSTGRSQRPTLAHPRRSRHPSEGRMWVLGGDDGAGTIAAHTIGGAQVTEDIEVASVRSAQSDWAPRRSGAESPLQSFTSAAPNGKLARLGQRHAVPLHQQRIGWE